MKRLFLAIPVFPDEQFLAVYTHLQKGLRTEKIRWVKPENMHLTLKFFGEIPIEKIDLINKVCKKLLLNHPPFQLQLKKTGIFGSRYKPRVIWFGIGENEQLFALANALLQQLDKAGFLLDRQNFVPHLTLGRINHIRNKTAFQEVVKVSSNIFIQEMQVEKVILFESELRPKGVVYHIIEEYVLGETTNS